MVTTEFGPGAGEPHMCDDGGDVRCGRCDSRYCFAGCYAGEPGYVERPGVGWIAA